MGKHLPSDMKITMSTNNPNNKPVTISGNLFSQVANSYKQPKKPCCNCRGEKFYQTKHYYWVCANCGQLSGWRKGDELRRTPNER